ncbi:hypothetical protein IAG25_15650 [Caballeronia sp. EK]|uniref:DUF3846 domain-containing protein n=1 Tax=Caballeronia sp. EK TaxID=2767469 RepID=UPI00165507AA|nr:hypothetical protein [Caballeronia sp. EK]MBC8638256.1 hypothetical protein [Caballeronia sp. EK]
MKAYLIDPFMQTVTEFERDGSGTQDRLQELYKAIGCDLVQAVYPDDTEGDVIYVDEEGLFKPEQALFFCTLWPHQPLVGRGVWVGTARGGYDADPRMSLDYVREHIVWLLGL